MAAGGGGKVERGLKKEQFQDDLHKCLTFNKKGECQLFKHDQNRLILLGIETELNCFIEISNKQTLPKIERPFKIEVIQGNLTESTADVLVNTVAGARQTLSKSSGVVAKAFFDAGGAELEEAYQSAGAVAFNDITVTSSFGSLMCAWVIHLGTDKWNKDSNEGRNQVKSNIRQCLEAANNKGATSIAFPTIGCGKLGYPIEEVADAFASEYQQLWKDNPNTTLKVLYIVVHEEDKVESFQKRIAGAESGEVAFKVVAVAEDPLTKVLARMAFNDIIYVHVFAHDQATLDQACGKVNTFRNDNYREATIKDKVVSTFSGAQKRTIRRSPDAVIDIAGDIVKLYGNKSSVLEAESKVRDMIAVIEKNRPPPAPAVPPAKKNPDDIKKAEGHGNFLTALQDTTIFLPGIWSKHKGPAGKATKGYNPGDNCIQPASQAEYSAIEQLVQTTALYDKVGHGRDAVGLSYTKLHVTDIQRIENPQTYMRYAQERQQHVFNSSKKVVPRISTISTDGEVKTRAAKQLNDILVPEINEYYLFHGTSPSHTNMATIRQQGLDPRVCGSGMFGKGIYFCESSTKADQYTDKKQARTPGDHFMFLTRVIVGNAYMAPTPCNPFTRPPCTTAGCNQCACTTHPELYNSIIGTVNEHGIKLLFREFVIFDKNQCYPEYLITYQRH